MKTKILKSFQVDELEELINEFESTVNVLNVAVICTVSGLLLAVISYNIIEK